MTRLSVLVGRLKDAIPEEYHKEIEQEVSQYRTETEIMGKNGEKPGQARLTEQEKARLPLGNQHTRWNVIRWQVVKGAAIHHGVRDWIAHVDPTLTYEENVGIMKKVGTGSSSSSMKYPPADMLESRPTGEVWGGSDA